MPQLHAASPEVLDTAYVLSTVDKSGRISDRSIIRALGWAPGTRLNLHARAGLIVAGPATDGIYPISDTGFCTLPLELRRYCRIKRADRVLLAGNLDTDILVIHPLAAVHAVLAEVHAQMSAAMSAAVVGGDAR